MKHPGLGRTPLGQRGRAQQLFEVEPLMSNDLHPFTSTEFLLRFMRGFGFRFS